MRPDMNIDNALSKLSVSVEALNDLLGEAAFTGLEARKIDTLFTILYALEASRSEFNKIIREF